MQTADQILFLLLPSFKQILDLSSAYAKGIQCSKKVSSTIEEFSLKQTLASAQLIQWSERSKKACVLIDTTD